MLGFFNGLLLAFLIFTISSFADSSLFYSDELDAVILRDMDDLYTVNQDFSDGPDIFALDGLSTADDWLEPLTSPSLDLSTLDLSGLPSPDFPDSSDFLMAADSSPCVFGSGRILSRAQSCSGNPDANPAYKAIPIPLYEETSKTWCSKTAVSGFENIPVCSPDGPYASGTGSNLRVQPQLPLSGFVSLDRATLSEFDVTRFLDLLESGAFKLEEHELTMNIVCSDGC